MRCSSMSLHASLLKAKRCEQRSQYDAALQIYQGLLRLVPSHPRVNGVTFHHIESNPFSAFRSHPVFGI